ncbi:RNA-dependent RNA polymerase 1 [Grifola frondosa]|uniref:RNA-dependent RNA polymerase n=1 Tax=Grifola frondosa TaxID=5627 RepID=A0A1C7MKW0_GRIFR|nr:RNA-dependent RNA polymerase 1 [Grifola frondosa]
MEIDLCGVAFQSTVGDVKRAVAGVLHGQDFFEPSDSKARPINFKVVLEPGRGGIQNNGTGRLMLPNLGIGNHLLRWVREPGHCIVVDGHKIRFSRSQRKLKLAVAEMLGKTPYVDPTIEEAKRATIEKLNRSIHIAKIQFGIFYRRPEDPTTSSRVFFNEYEISHQSRSAGILTFEHDHKLIRIALGDASTDQIQHNIAVTFSNIRKFAIGLHLEDGPFICFDLLVPPMLERQRWNRELTGVEWQDNRKFRQRLDSLDPAHAIVAPYAHQMRMILHDKQDVYKFANLCKVAGLPRPRRMNIDAFTCRVFSTRQLHNVRIWVKQLSWPVAFQIEALLHNGLLTTNDLLNYLYKPINELHASSPETASNTLRYFTDALRTKSAQESFIECFNQILPESSEHKPLQLPKGTFPCHHITFTPTRILLEGPYVIQSNRVIRSYPEHQEHFIRVDFRDEDRLQYRWSREVDGTSLLKERVGGILKNGFELGGRRFEFLAYSQSALREHAVWFLNPFHHPEEGYVTAQKIRDGLGDFSGVIKYPSKYAARIAQAFTATHPSVSIRRDQWEEVPDLGEAPYLFTDGVGTISMELGDLIWEALCKERPESQRYSIKPSAYQIRFLGYKGMVVIDERLEGIKMRLRKSMNKFKVRNEDLAEIEIARAFERPSISYLNRPLVTLLEDRGIDKKAFVMLQDKARGDILTATDSIAKTVTFLKAHQLGASYFLPVLLQHLAIGMRMARESSTGVLRDPFLDQLLFYLLVGVADEGPTYVADGCENVFTLDEAEIFACIQNPGDLEPTYLKGFVLISRSPVVHPGDVQRVFAIGKPPDDKLCFFRNLKNVVVLPSSGTRSLASCLGGGDLDGDLYSIIKYGPLLLSDECPAASYLPTGTRALDDDRDSTVEDICDFIVEYLNSDVLGLLSDRHLIIADQSNAGTFDQNCLDLAQLCSQAVDYPKNGIPVDIHDSPRLLVPYKPDWHQAEDAKPRQTDYYESTRALGELFRNISIIPPRPPSPLTPPESPREQRPLSDSISCALKPYIERQLCRFHNDDSDVAEIKPLFRKYEEELQYICVTHALSDSPGARLTEEEVVVGTILAQCSQHRWRTDRTYRMRLHSAMLVRDIQNKLFPRTEVPSKDDLLHGLTQGWLAWDFSVRNRSFFGAQSFGLVGLGIVCYTLELLGGLTLV